MNILEAYDLTRSCTAAAGLAGCSHHTVARYVQLREQGLLPDGVEPARRERVINPFMGKIEEWVDRSGGKVRADVAFDKLTALGFDGSERTVRRAVAEVKLNHRRGQRRVFRPWLPEPGMWALYGMPHKAHYVDPASMRRRRCDARWSLRSLPGAPHSHRLSR